MLAESITALAAAGGVAVVQAAGTDAWRSVRERAAELLGRGEAERRQAELVRLDQTEAGVTGEGDVERQRVYWEGVWQTRWEVLLQALRADEREQVVAELRALVASAGSSSQTPGQQAGAGGLVAGGDVSVTAEGGSVAGGVVRVDGGVHLAPPFPHRPQR